MRFLNCIYFFFLTNGTLNHGVLAVDSDVPAEVTKILANAKNKEVTDKFKQQQQPAAKKSRADKQKYNGAAKQQ